MGIQEETSKIQIKKNNEYENKNEFNTKTNILEEFNLFNYKNNRKSNFNFTNNKSYHEVQEQLETLTEHLEQQIRVSNFNVLEKEIAIRLLGEMNTNGYLEQSEIALPQIANELFIPKSWIEIVRKKMLILGPIGCLSLNTKECLLIQLKFIGYKNYELVMKMVSEHFELVQNKKLRQLVIRLKSNRKDITKAFNILSTLELNPGRNFAIIKTNINYQITPDVYLENIDGIYKISPNDNGLPKLFINHNYIKYINKNNSKIIKKYIKKKNTSSIIFIKMHFSKTKNYL